MTCSEVEKDRIGRLFEALRFVRAGENLCLEVPTELDDAIQSKCNSCVESCRIQGWFNGKTITKRVILSKLGS